MSNMVEKIVHVNPHVEIRIFFPCDATLRPFSCGTKCFVGILFFLCETSVANGSR